MESKGELGGVGGWVGAGARGVAIAAALLVPWSGGMPAAARAETVAEHAAPLPAAGHERCELIDALDATTLRLRCASGSRTLVLRGVRAPQPGSSLGRPTPAAGESFGDEARALVTSWLSGRDLDADARDGELRVDGVEVRPALVARGLASCIDEELGGDPASAELHGAEHAARAAGLGIWSYDAWRRHERARAAAVELRSDAPPIDDREPLGAVARRASQASWAERKAAFEAALAVAASTHVSGAAALSPPLETGPSVGPRSRAKRPAVASDDASTAQAPSPTSPPRGARATARSSRASRPARRAPATGAGSAADDGPIVTCSPLGRELCLPPREPMPELTLRRAKAKKSKGARGGNRARRPAISP